MSLQITASPDDPALLLDLPWELPLEKWPDDQLVALPRGISRHVVRFVRLTGRVYAVKEVSERPARREYQLLRQLNRLDVPCVEPVGVITGRHSVDGAPLDPALVTRHLQFSLPYRALFSRTLRADTATRLLDALAVLLVRLHLAGFYWGDVSLSNTLFRRDAGAYAAYLVDAETGDLHKALTDGQRAHDLELARVNIAGELMDLEAGSYLHHSMDPVQTAERIVARYDALWREITYPQVIEMGSRRYELDARLRRLNDLGFDVSELTLSAHGGGVRIQPKVVDAGHHARRLLRLTGLDAEENQARRLLNDLDTFRAATKTEADEEIVAHRWLTFVFEPVVSAVPRELRGKLEPAELFHELLEHRWFLSEAAGRDVGLDTAIDSYITTVLVNKPDERAVLGARVGTPSTAGSLEDTAEMRLVFPD